MKHPLYVISKGRWDLKQHTARFLIKDEVPVKIVVEPQEAEKYIQRFGAEKILILPFSNLGLGGIPARNWVWEHAKASGAERHWILDDNIGGMVTWVAGKRRSCPSKPGFEAVESFVDRYENLAIGGINYAMFGMVGPGSRIPPFYLNSRVYSCLLILNSLPYRWREDTDLCLQVLTNDWCTANINAFMIKKAATMTCKGGNTSELYKGNGRLIMSRSLEHQWKHMPGLVKTTIKWGRPQHSVNWKIFKTQLKLKAPNG